MREGVGEIEGGERWRKSRGNMGRTAEDVQRAIMTTGS